MQRKTKKKKIVFIYRDIRSSLIKEFGEFGITQYCILDYIRRRRKEDNMIFEQNQKQISYFFSLSDATISYHIKKMTEKGILIKNEEGIRIEKKFDYNMWSETYQKGSFILLDFEIFSEIEAEHEMTINQFAILSLIYSIKITRSRELSVKSIRRLSNLDKKMINSAISKFKDIGILERKGIKISNNPDFKILSESFKELFSICNSESVLREYKANIILNENRLANRYEDDNL